MTSLTFSLSFAHSYTSCSVKFSSLICCTLVSSMLVFVISSMSLRANCSIVPCNFSKCVFLYWFLAHTLLTCCFNSFSSVSLVTSVLRLGKSQETTVRDSPQSTFPTSLWLFGIGNPSGLQSGYPRSSNKTKRFYRLRLSPLYIFLYFFILKVWYASAYLTCRLDKEC